MQYSIRFGTKNMCCPDDDYHDDDDDDDDDVKEVDATNDQQAWKDLDANLLRYEYSQLIIRQKTQR